LKERNKHNFSHGTVGEQHPATHLFGGTRPAAAGLDVSERVRNFFRSRALTSCRAANWADSAPSPTRDRARTKSLGMDLRKVRWRVKQRRSVRRVIITAARTSDMGYAWDKIRAHQMMNLSSQLWGTLAGILSVSSITLPALCHSDQDSSTVVHDQFHLSYTICEPQENMMGEKRNT